MRSKLQKFSIFAQSLLPHETRYLLSIQQFHDEERLEILKRIHQQVEETHQDPEFDESIDKRKYSHLKNWIVLRLQQIDVDESYNWMSDLDRKITTDSINSEEEKSLLRAIKGYEHPMFFFRRFYDLALNYRQFLLIRMRYVDHATVDQFLTQFKFEYQRSQEVMDRLHEATRDVVGQYADNDTESQQWEPWLEKIFYDETLDGHSRYMALIRLIFLGLNYRRFEQLVEKFDYLDEQISQGNFYSKRLLLNYYSNRLLLHSRFHEYDIAAKYGYLSIRNKNYDYIFYVNNLASVLLRQEKYEEALKLMKEAYNDMKQSFNFHNKIGFVSFYIRCLNATEQYRSAESYAESFLRAYKKEIFEYRWHLFFVTYLENLLIQKKYKKIIKIVRQHHLEDKDKLYKQRKGYLPSLSWIFDVARYKEMLLSKEDLSRRLQSFFEGGTAYSVRSPQIQNLLSLLKTHIPDISRKLEWDQK